jgi:hypothetical protein
MSQQAVDEPGQAAYDTAGQKMTLLGFENDDKAVGGDKREETLEKSP